MAARARSGRGASLAMASFIVAYLLVGFVAAALLRALTSDDEVMVGRSGAWLMMLLWPVVCAVAALELIRQTLFRP